MDYKKLYDEALERAKQFHNKELYAECNGNLVEYIFPELTENKDEKIRKEMLNVFKQLDECTTICGRNYDYAKWLAWLEKQKHTKKDVDIESMVKAYKQRIVKQDGMENNPLIDMCLVCFKHGVENTLGELNCEQILANSAKTCKNEQNDQTNFTEFEEALADVCRGWIGDEIGWEDYIKMNADALLKISFKRWNKVQDAPFEHKPNKCDGCNNVKGCVTCVDGDQWGHYKEVDDGKNDIDCNEKKPNGGIVMEDFTEGDGFYKVNLDYLSKEQVKEIESIVEKWNPDLKESEDEEIKKDLLEFLESVWHLGKNAPFEKWDKSDCSKWMFWLEKQGEQSIQNVPTREIVWAIWDLGNEWKRLTHGKINTEHGTQLDYILKHWQESEYYLREVQGEKKSDICDGCTNVKGCITCVDGSLKERIKGE